MATRSRALEIPEACFQQALRYPLEVRPDDGFYQARVGDASFPYLVGTGGTPEAARAELIRGLAAVIAWLRHDGVPVPPPGGGTG